MSPSRALTLLTLICISFLTRPANAAAARTSVSEEKSIELSINAGYSSLKGTNQVQSGLSLMGDIGIGVTENLMLKSLIFTANGEYRGSTVSSTNSQAVNRERITIFGIGPSYNLQKGAVNASAGAIVGGAIRSSENESYNAITNKVESASNASDARFAAGATVGLNIDILNGFLLTTRAHYLATLGGGVSVLSAMGGLGYRF